MGRHLKEKRNTYKRNRRKRLKQQGLLSNASDGDSATTSDNNSWSNGILESQAGGNTGSSGNDNNEEKHAFDTEDYQNEVDTQQQPTEHFSSHIDNDKLYLGMLKYYRQKDRFLRMKIKLQNPRETDYYY